MFNLLLGSNVWMLQAWLVFCFLLASYNFWEDNQPTLLTIYIVSKNFNFNYRSFSTSSQFFQILNLSFLFRIHCGSDNFESWPSNCILCLHWTSTRKSLRRSPIYESCLCKTVHLSHIRYEFATILLKGRVHCFSMQVVINKCFLLNPEKKLAQIRLIVFEKNAKTHFNSEKWRHRAEG